MNTVLKGDLYENECYNLVRRLVDNEDLGLAPNNCRVFQKKGYFSKDRGSNIIFDISIEVWMKGASTYSMLVLVECKDYSTSRVPINDIEEFNSKVKQVAGTKGIVISSNLFAESAYNFARSKGITLIQSNQNITFNVILHKSKRYNQLEEENEYGPISIDDYNDPLIRHMIHRKWERLIETKIINSFVFHLNAQMLPREQTIPVLSREDIEEMTVEILTAYKSTLFNQSGPLSWLDFKRYLFEVFGLSVVHTEDMGIDSQGRKILSQCKFALKLIEIHYSLVDTNRYNFALAHEIGHYFLHNKLTLSQSSYENFEDAQYDYSTAKYKIENNRNWIEWQANAFAASFIMPREPFLTRLGLIQNKIGLRPGNRLFVDRQKCNQKDFRRITRELATVFNVSRSSVIYRLETLRMIEFDTSSSSRTVGQILHDIYPSFFED